jgi:hypothetical protein
MLGAIDMLGIGVTVRARHPVIPTKLVDKMGMLGVGGRVGGWNSYYVYRSHRQGAHISSPMRREYAPRARRVGAHGIAPSD